MHARRPKVLIRTLPIDDGNYGGILQSYALQRTLLELGAAPVTDVSRSDAEPRAKSALRTMLATTPVISSLAKPQWRARVEHDRRARAIGSFAQRHIETTRLFDASPRERDRQVAENDLLLVGSDQVWRADYADVPSYLFSFVRDPSVRRASYAASFGVGDVRHYGQELLTRMRALLEGFEAVSVREPDAVELCRDVLGVDADWHLDPTLLLPASHYSALGPAETSPSEKPLAVYLLDADEGTIRLVRELGRLLRLRIDSIRGDDGQAWTTGPGVPATVERWLAGIEGARYLVTDSFHGTVFALIHNIPFLTLANRQRGMARLDGLLGIVGLTDRLVDGCALDPSEAMARLTVPVDWRHVHDIIERERARSRNYLASLLDGSDGAP